MIAQNRKRRRQTAELHFATDTRRNAGALRVPETAHPERLRGLAWWVDDRQRLQGIAREGCGPG